MKKSITNGYKCLKCIVIFYLVLLCVLGVAVGLCACSLLLFRDESHVPKARNVVLYFLIFPTLLTVSATAIGAWSIKTKNIKLLKFFAVLLAVTAAVEFSGVIWCFVSLPDINEQIKVQMKEKFESIATQPSMKNWWNQIQSRLECCGLHGPTDYSLTNIPFSCCGSDPKDSRSGSCSFVFQKGCSSVLERQINTDLVVLGLMSLCTALLRIPGAILSWLFAHKMSKERL